MEEGETLKVLERVSPEELRNILRTRPYPEFVQLLSEREIDGIVLWTYLPRFLEA
ncbi:MAG: hypothetical protein HY731_06110 [Candidatus Tectomicrobia bacterium]|nr:hypothetical protein [Candidatus Tectomicrobia bacterium]